jgi:hypothetical protein
MRTASLAFVLSLGKKTGPEFTLCVNSGPGPFQHCSIGLFDLNPGHLFGGFL